MGCVAHTIAHTSKAAAPCSPCSQRELLVLLELFDGAQVVQRVVNEILTDIGGTHRAVARVGSDKKLVVALRRSL
eukprot:CAMPEP_0181201814 /NCGR_PEP_ID=MMETSP1096-20121128/18502_1 /TAXON_ID=156174 ORGANISM="Chrysochromulina ericina, Strain CCMP281" /NCGR_SAMPLE_ID=MMETSP1096 /ASSEMBLY_ACC=CAM_ASM_000453 /LENGTH=74 /DNA_ID=CAMNT_0023292271 /DNA_START=437 /DNA_END=661 /DNA_ORIENTATION=-